MKLQTKETNSIYDYIGPGDIVLCECVSEVYCTPHVIARPFPGSLQCTLFLKISRIFQLLFSLFESTNKPALLFIHFSFIYWTVLPWSSWYCVDDVMGVQNYVWCQLCTTAKASSFWKYSLRWVDHSEPQKKDENFDPFNKFTITLMYTGSQQIRKRIWCHLCLK
jgi:hypothetical protein